MEYEVLETDKAFFFEKDDGTPIRTVSKNGVISIEETTWHPNFLGSIKPKNISIEFTINDAKKLKKCLDFLLPKK